MGAVWPAGGVLEVGGKTIHVMYAWDFMQLPFRVELEDFQVERDEGSMNVAGWTSKVVFHDDLRGLTQRASIWMNHPAWFNGYKFSQASWNPNDLKYTALQVKKDPLIETYVTWTGAILIVGGIALMFWGRGWLQKKTNGDGRRATGDGKTRTGEQRGGGCMKKLMTILVMLTVAGAAAFADDLDFTALKFLAVQKDGRKKPLDTVALETVEKLTGKNTFSIPRADGGWSRWTC